MLVFFGESFRDGSQFGVIMIPVGDVADITQPINEQGRGQFYFARDSLSKFVGAHSAGVGKSRFIHELFNSFHTAFRVFGGIHGNSHNLNSFWTQFVLQLDEVRDSFTTRRTPGCPQIHHQDLIVKATIIEVATLDVIDVKFEFEGLKLANNFLAPPFDFDLVGFFELIQVLAKSFLVVHSC